MKSKIVEHNKVSLWFIYATYNIAIIALYFGMSGIKFDQSKIYICLVPLLIGTYFFRKYLPEKLIMNEEEIVYDRLGTRIKFFIHDITKLEIGYGNPIHLYIYQRTHKNPELLYFESLNQGLFEFVDWVKEIRQDQVEIINETIKFNRKFTKFLSYIFLLNAWVIIGLIVHYRIIPELSK